jgi:hypothetical protein
VHFNILADFVTAQVCMVRVLPHPQLIDLNVSTP